MKTPRPRLLGGFDGFSREWLGADLAAGLTVWAVMVPEALAYATIAGVPPVVGLYAAIPALLLYPLFGSSRQLVIGPMSATAALSAGVVGVIVPPGGEGFVALTAALAIVTGVAALVAGLLRAGFLASLISEPVLKGFVIGLALVILVGQLPDLIGVEGGEGNFFARTWELIASLPEVHLPTLVLGVSSLAVIVALRRVAPLVPSALVAVAAGIAAAGLLGLADQGVEIVGEIPSGLPSLGLPEGLGLGDYLQLAGPAIGVLLIGFAEGLGAGKAYASREGSSIDPDQELLGLGVANLGAGLSSGMVVNASLSKTAVNVRAGGRSQLSGVVAGVLTLITLLFLTGLFSQLPEATLAAVVVAAVVELVDLDALRRLFRIVQGRGGQGARLSARPDFTAAVAALLGVLVFDILPGLVIGIGVSLLLLLFRSSRPEVVPLGRLRLDHRELWVDPDRHPDARPVDGVVVVRVEAGLYFANADHVRDRIRALVSEETRVVVLDAETTPSVDVTAAAMLAELSEDLERRGVSLVLARVLGPVQSVLEATGEAGRLTIYDDVPQAISMVDADDSSG